MHTPDTSVGDVKAIRGKVHNYLAMVLDYSFQGEVKINMVNYVKLIVKEFQEMEDLRGSKFSAL